MFKNEIASFWSRPGAAWRQANTLPGPLLLGCLLLFAAITARAQLEIDIDQSVAAPLPVAIVPFQLSGDALPEDTDVAAVIRADLARSGQFAPMRLEDMIQRPSRGSDINFAAWRLLRTDDLLIGRITNNGNAYLVEVELYDVLTQQRLLGQRLNVLTGELRGAAHRISDLVYEKLLGIKGAFFTRIAYVAVTRSAAGTRYALTVADADGFNPQTVVSSREPLLSPAWSPDSRMLAYVSFEQRRSIIYLQNIATGARRVLASYPGINGAPAFSPDGKRLALTLSRSGNPEIYIMDIGSGKLKQITHHWGIDTEAAFSKDGKTLYFTSDRGGRPNIYEVSLAGGRPKRLTFAGDYNARVTISPDGQHLALANGENNIYRIGVLDTESGAFLKLSGGKLDESPSFAPNGRMILYASNDGSRGVLRAVSVDGRVSQRLILADGEVREPAWSPFRAP